MNTLEIANYLIAKQEGKEAKASIDAEKIQEFLKDKHAKEQERSVLCEDFLNLKVCLKELKEAVQALKEKAKQIKN